MPDEFVFSKARGLKKYLDTPKRPLVTIYYLYGQFEVLCIDKAIEIHPRYDNNDNYNSKRY